MWQRFTERARKVVFYAQEEAGRLGENYVSTEHLLLGLVRENDSVAARIFERIGVEPGRIRTEIEGMVARGNGRMGQDMQLTPRAKRVIDLAYDESRLLDNNYMGTEHLLLGLIREGEGLAGRVLSKLGVELDRTRREVIDLQEGSSVNLPAQPRVSADVPLDDRIDTRRHLRVVRREPIRLKSLERQDAPFHTEIEAAVRLAAMQGQPFVTPAHLAIVLLSDPNETVIRILGQYDVDAQALLAQLPAPGPASGETRDSSPDEDGGARPLALSPAAGALLVRALEKAHGLMNEEVVGREHLLLAMLEEPSIAPVFTEVGMESYGVVLELLRLRERGL
ncbi:MAG: Clp protease N-terminal domain-containing protein [Capsulimonadaceae bacterium]